MRQTFFLEARADSALNETVCCGVISSGQGIRRFCTMTRLEGKPTCGVGTHVIKAKLEGNSFFVKIKVKGGSKALMSNTIQLNEMLQEDIAYFQDQRHAPAEWESRFGRAKLAKHSNGIPLSQYLYDDQDFAPDKDTSVLDYGPTPENFGSTATSLS